MRTRVLLALFPVFLGLAMPVRADEWTKKYTVTAKPDVRVETNDGNVTVDSWDRKEIDARVETMGWRIAENDVRIVERQTGDRVEFEIRVPRRHWNFDFGGRRRWLKIELKIPREADLGVKTGDGHVTVQPLSGSVNIHTGDGHITLTSIKGEMHLSTGDGHIEARGLDGRLEASSGDGHINVEGRFDLLNLHTGDGHIDARALAGSKMASSWTIRTDDGRVTLHLPDDFAADLDAHTNDGRISTDLPVTLSGSLSRSTVRGKINGGGPMLTVHTGDGSIHLQRL